MALLRRFFQKKPPDGLVEIAERVYVFDSCFKRDLVEDGNYNIYINGIVSQLRANSPDTSYMVLNFPEGENQSQLAQILCEYDMIVVNYQSYEGYPLLTLKRIRHFLRSCENWLSLGQLNVLLMHCDRAGWPLLAFMIATLLIYINQCTGEQRTLNMIHKRGPRKFLHLITPLNSFPSQLRYLHYISSRNEDMEWPPLDKTLFLDFIVLRLVPNMDKQGCCSIVRLYGQDPFVPSCQNPKVLFSASTRSNTVRHQKEVDSEAVKIDVHCCVHGDIVFECINLDEDQEHEEIVFRVMLNTSFIRSSILMLNRDEIDTLWNAIYLFPKDFRAEVHFSEIDVQAQTGTSSSRAVKDGESPPIEAFAKAQDVFCDVESHESKADGWPKVLEQKNASTMPNDNLEITSGLVDLGFHGASVSTEPEASQNLASPKLSIDSSSSLEKQPNSPAGHSIDMDPVKARAQCGTLLPAFPQSCLPKIISPRLSQPFRCTTSLYNNALQGSPRPISRYQSSTSSIGISAVLHDHVADNTEELTHIVASSPSSLASNGECAGDLCKRKQPTFTSVLPPPPMPTPSPPSPAHFSLQRIELPVITRTSAATSPLLPGLSLQDAEVPVAMGTYATSPAALPPSSAPLALVRSVLQHEEVSVVTRTSSTSQLPPLPPPSPPARSSLQHVEFYPIMRTSAVQPPSPPPMLLPLHSPTCSNQSSSESFLSHVVPLPPPPPSLPSPPKYSNQSTSESFLSLVGPPSPQMHLLLPPPPTPPPPPPKCSNELISEPFLSLAAPPPAPLKCSNQSISESFPSLVGPPSALMTPLPPPPPPPPSPPPLPTSSSQATSGTCCSSRDDQKGALINPRTSLPPPPPPPTSRAYLALTPVNSLSTPSSSPTPLTIYDASAPTGDSLLSSSKQRIEAATKCSDFTTGPIGSSLVPPQLPLRDALNDNNVLKTAPDGPSIPVPSAPPIQGLSKAPHSSQQSQMVKSNGSVPPAPRPPSITKERPFPRLPLKNQGQSKRSSLKPYHWLKLTRVMQGSLWAETQKSEDASKTPEFDISELENLFAACTLDPKHGSTAGKSNIRASGLKRQLIELRRAYNCEIMLSKVKIPLPDLMSSVLALDDSVLDADQVENLIKFCPTKEEMELLMGYKGDRENLGKCERFFLELMKVPRVESKLRVFYFKMQFCSQVSDLRNNLNVVNSASEEIRSSVKLKRIMQTILMLGNVLNQGTARGSAVGFRLDSLLKLTDTRAWNCKMTLMHYLCKVLSEKLPELLDFPKDLVSLEPSTKIQLKFLAEEMQAISKGLEKVVQELHASENDGPVSENFCTILKEFIAYAEGEARALASLYSLVGRNADALAIYLGEDPARCPFEQVVSTLLNFVRLFIRAHHENSRRLEFEKNKVQKESKK